MLSGTSSGNTTSAIVRVRAPRRRIPGKLRSRRGSLLPFTTRHSRRGAGVDARNRMPEARVVVVEKSEWLRRLLLTGLRDHGLEVEASRDAKEGLEKIRALAPDCILCGTR